MVQANKAAGIAILICAVYIISGTTCKYIVSGRNACNAAAVNVCAVALDKVDFYIGDFVFIYAAFFRTGQFNDRVTDSDNGKVALTGSRLLVECNADLQTKQRNGKRFAIGQEFNCKHPAQINIQYT